MAKTVWVDGDKSLGIPGTRIFAAFMNKIFSHRHDGLDQDGSAPLDYAQDVGVVNAYAANFNPALTAHIAGMPLKVRIAATNTVANPTFTPNPASIAPLTITRIAPGTTLAPLGPGDLLVNQIAVLVYNGTGYTLMNPAQVPDNSVSYAQLTPGAVGTIHILNGNVTGDKIAKTFPTGGSQQVLNGTTWTPAAGMYMMSAVGGVGKISLQSLQGGAWYGNTDFGGGIVLTDGIGFRFWANGDTVSIYWAKL